MQQSSCLKLMGPHTAGVLYTKVAIMNSIIFVTTNFAYSLCMRENVR